MANLGFIFMIDERVQQAATALIHRETPPALARISRSITTPGGDVQTWAVTASTPTRVCPPDCRREPPYRDRTGA